MHNISNLFHFETLHMFRTVSPSIIRSLRLYIQLASGNEMEPSHVVPTSKQPQYLYDINLKLYVQS